MTGTLETHRSAPIIAATGLSHLALRVRDVTRSIGWRQAGLVRFPWVNHRCEPWEPEPLRWLGVTTMLTRLRIAEKLDQLRS